MKRAIAILIGLSFVLLPHRACIPQAPDRAELQKILKLPRMDMDFTIGFHYVSTGLVIDPDLSKTAEQIASLTAKMKGDSTDAFLWLQIGDLYDLNSDSAQSKAAYMKAAALYRPDAEQESADAATLIRFGESLEGAEQAQGAEDAYRRAVVKDPQDWRGWSGLALALCGRSLKVFGGTGVSFIIKSPGDYQKFMGLLKSHQPTAEQAAAAEQALTEAEACIDRAVAVAPNDPVPYLSRFICRSFGTKVIRSVLNAFRAPTAGANDGAEQLYKQFLEAMLSSQGLTDLRKAAALRPGDPLLAGFAAFFSLMGFAQTTGNNGLFGEGVDLANVPEDLRTQLQNALATAKRSVRSADPVTSGRAAEILGFLQFITRDYAQAEKTLRPLVLSGTAREKDLDLLVGVLVTSKRYSDLASIFEQVVKKRDSVRGRLILAKAYEKLDRKSDSEAQVNAAVAQSPDDFDANLALSSLLLKRATDDSELREAARVMTHAYDHFPKSPSQTQWTNYAIVRGIALAISNQVTEARSALKDALSHDPENEDAKQALALIGN